MTRVRGKVTCEEETACEKSRSQTPWVAQFVISNSVYQWYSIFCRRTLDIWWMAGGDPEWKMRSLSPPGENNAGFSLKHIPGMKYYGTTCSYYLSCTSRGIIRDQQGGELNQRCRCCCCCIAVVFFIAHLPQLNLHFVDGLQPANSGGVKG